MTARETYSKEELEAYFDRIGLPLSVRCFSVTGMPWEDQYEFLLQLQKHQLMRVPFENLTLHYSWHRVIDVRPDRLFEKIVLQPGRGGYCMENNSLFHTALISLGFDAYIVGARVYNKDTSRYGGLTHCLNIVALNGVRYAVDVCFGSRVPVLPLRLCHGEVQRHSAPGQMRVRYDNITQGLRVDQKLWIYEHRINEDAPWVPQYCFAELEFLPEDIRVMNLAPARSPSSFFTYKVLCVRFTSENELYSKDGDPAQYPKNHTLQETTAGEIDGALIIEGSTFKWRKKGEKQWERIFQSEDDRTECLKCYFGIELTREEKRAINGTVGEVLYQSSDC